MGKKYFVRKVDEMKRIVQTAGRNALNEFSPEFAHFNDDILFGENWNNQDIDLKTRSIITVVALMSSGITDSSLIYHLPRRSATAGESGKQKWFWLPAFLWQVLAGRKKASGNICFGKSSLCVFGTRMRATRSGFRM